MLSRAAFRWRPPARARPRSPRWPTLLPRGTPVYFSAVPTLTPQELVAGAALLRKGGLEPVVHIAARRIPAAADLQDLLDQAARRSRCQTAAGDRRRRRYGRRLSRRAGGHPERPPARGRHRGDRHRRLSGRPCPHRRRPAGSRARPEDRRGARGRLARAYRQPVLVFARRGGRPGSSACAPAASRCR